jgi:hypothetical protein
LLVSDKVVADCSQQSSSFPTRERPCRPSILDVADVAPSDPALTPYDEQHAITYMRLLDADAEGADWREVARIVLHVDPDSEPDRARLDFDSHLAPRQMDGKVWIQALASLRLASLNLSAAQIRQDGRVDSPNFEARRLLKASWPVRRVGAHFRV